MTAAHTSAPTSLEVSILDDSLAHAQNWADRDHAKSIGQEGYGLFSYHTMCTHKH